MDISSFKRLRRRGFTLIELLLVIGIIAILASIVIVAINPTKQLGDARNAQRRSDVNTMLNAVYQYAIDNNGAMPTSPSVGCQIPVAPAATLPAALSNFAKPICQSAVSEVSAPTCVAAMGTAANGCVNLRALTGAYIVNIPQDPTVVNGATGTGTRYSIVQQSINGSNRITVAAMTSDRGIAISATR